MSAAVPHLRNLISRGLIAFHGNEVLGIDFQRTGEQDQRSSGVELNEIS